MSATLTLILLLVLPVGAVAQAADPPDVRRAANTITPEDIETGLRVIAHDSMRGRDTPSPGLEKTARWVADQFKSFGLEPAGDGGSYLQRFSVQTVAVDVEGSEARVQGGPALDFGRDLGFPFGPTGEGDFSGPVVVLSGSRSWTEGPGAAELDGKHVILVSSPGRDGAWSGAARRVIRTIRLESDPASVIVAADRDEGGWQTFLQRQRAATVVRIGQGASSRAPVFEIRDPALASLLAGSGIDLQALRERFGDTLRAQPLAGVTLTLSPRARTVHETSAPNTVGVLPGSDPALRDEYIVFSAHMDHVGVRSGAPGGDSIYNGADDDGSGTVTVVELAQAYSQLDTRPRRSMIFLAVSGEEKGLWGSEHFVDNPPVPVERMMADFNIDMIGRNWSDTIVAIGQGHSDLGRALNRVNGRHPELDMTAIEDPWPQQNFYRRSDHFNFARRGVPILFFFSGTHEDYHQPGDEVDKIDFEKTSRVGRLIFYLGLEVANGDEPPRWDPESYRQIVGDPR